ncbi:MAG: hypothetical protein LBB48_06135 [Treponema sp.]|nr:hypothetical protein [Treponema sp.]
MLAAGVLIALGACASSSSGASGGSASGAPLYTGSGGKGLSLAILAPSGSGLSAEQNYLPTLVQGELVAGVSKYSAISVLDRVNLEKVLTETESGIYEDAAEYVELGKITGQDYIMTGIVTKTGSGYALQIQVANAKENGATAASYSGTCSLEEFDNFSGIRRATADLFRQKRGRGYAGCGETPRLPVSGRRDTGKLYPCRMKAGGKGRQRSLPALPGIFIVLPQGLRQDYRGRKPSDTDAAGQCGELPLWKRGKAWEAAFCGFTVQPGSKGIVPWVREGTRPAPPSGGAFT